MMGAAVAMLLGPSIVSALLTFCIRPYRAWMGVANAALSVGALGASVWLTARVLDGEVPAWGPGEIVRVDALSALLAVCVTLVAALAAWLGPGRGSDEGLDAARVRRFRIFANLFAFTMLAAVTTNNVAVMWVAVEATTITSAI